MILNNVKNYRVLNRLIGRKPIETKCSEKYLTKIQFSTNDRNSDERNGNNYDIVINGGGIVGFATLLALKSSPFLRETKICLIEKQMERKSERSVGQSDNQLSNRVSSITTSSKRFFQRIGVWNHLKDYAKPIKEMYVWSDKYRNAINFRSDSNNLDEDIDEDLDVVCYVIENNRILSSLQSRINELEHNVCYGTVVTDVKSDTNGVRIDTKCLKNDYLNSVSTHLLVGCDGFDSVVRQKSNLDLFEQDLDQMGIVGTIAVESGVGNEFNEISFQRFVSFDNSVIALLPLSQTICSIVWSVSKESAKELMQLSEQQFVDHLNDTLFTEGISHSQTITQKLDELIGNLVPICDQTPRFSVPHVLSLIPDSRAVFPFKFSTTLPYVVGSPVDSKNNNKIVIIGDAAHRVHPLAGQGLNLGIGDADTLSQCIHNELARGETLFDNNSQQLEKCLFDFESKRQIKLIAMMSAIHSMPQLFSFVPSNLLNLFNSSEFLKQRIVNFANNN